MPQVVNECPECESLLSDYGELRYRYDEAKKSALADTETPESAKKSSGAIWEECQRQRQVILSHFLSHDQFQQVTGSFESCWASTLGLRGLNTLRAAWFSQISNGNA
jgi:hypothetical protein